MTFGPTAASLAPAAAAGRADGAGPAPGADVLAGLAAGPRPVPSARHGSSRPISLVFSLSSLAVESVESSGPGPALPPVPSPPCSTAILSYPGNVPSCLASCQLSAAPAGVSNMSAEHVGSVPAWPRDQPHSYLFGPSFRFAMPGTAQLMTRPAPAPEPSVLWFLPSCPPAPSLSYLAGAAQDPLPPGKVGSAKVQAGPMCGSRCWG